MRRWERERKGGRTPACPGRGAHPAGSCGLCPPQTPLLPWDGGFLSTLSLKTKKVFSHTQGRRAARTRNPSANVPPSFSRPLFSSLTTGIPGAPSCLPTALLTLLQRSQTDSFKTDGQLAGLPKRRYLLGPDPPPLPAASRSPALRDGSRLPPALPPPIFWPKSRPKACLPGTGTAAPTHALRAQSPRSGLRTRVRLPSAGR